MKHLAILLSVFISFLSASVSAKVPPIEDYARLPMVYDAALSPDGKFMAAIVDNGGTYILRVFNLADPSDQTVRGSTYDKGQKVKWVSWASNERILLSVEQTEKSGGTIYNTGYLYSIDRDVKDARLVLKPALMGKVMGKKGKGVIGYRQFNNRVVDFLPDDPDHILMAFGARDQFKIGVHKVNITNSNISRVNGEHLDIQDWTTDANHDVRLGEGRNDRTGDYAMLVRDADKDKWRSAEYYPGLNATMSTYGFTHNPNELVIGTRNGQDTLGLYVYDLVQKRRTRKLFHHDKYDISRVIRSSDGKRVVGVRYIADTDVNVFFDPEYKARMAKIRAKLPEYQIRFIDQTPDGNVVLFKAGAPSDPNVLFTYTFSTDKVQLVTQDYPELSKAVQGDVTSVKYTARDGFKIPGFITTPSKIADGIVPFKNLPFIIMPHGGPYARDTKSFDYLAQFMASRGYAVLQMNFRGSEGYGQAFESAGRKNWVVMQEDVEDGARWLVKKGYADPERICIVGWSYGGYAALMGAIKNPDLYACSVSIAGVTDLRDMINDIKKYRFGRHAAKNFVLRGFEDNGDIKANSPVKRAGEYNVPLLLVHGKKDVTVHFDQFTRMKRALKKSKAKVTYVELKDGDHSLTGYPDRLAMFKALDKFLLKNLGKSDAAP